MSPTGFGYKRGGGDERAGVLEPKILPLLSTAHYHPAAEDRRQMPSHLFPFREYDFDGLSLI